MRSVITAAAIAASALAPTAAAQSLTLESTFTLPQGTFDVLPDGRLLAITPAGDVQFQTSINGSNYITSNTLPAPNAAGFGASFLSISPSAGRVAIGNNEFNASNAVLVYDFTEFTLGLGLGTPVLPEATITTPNFDADWTDPDTLVVTGARSTTFTPIVNRLDIPSATAETVISPAGVFSGGITADGNTLLVGDGSSGDVRAFDAATFPGFPVAFSAGDLVASSTSASSIDTLGDLLLIAGQTFGGEGSALVIDRAAGTSITLQPAGPDAFYGGYFNHITNQLVVTAGDTAYVYAIPAPATLTLAPVALIAARRRRA